MMTHEPTADQAHAIAEVNSFLIDPDRKSFTLTGQAGTGKTTMLQFLSDLGRTAVICAPTNKATNVLRSKGFEKATTLDRVLNKSVYVPVQRDPTAEEIDFCQRHNIEVPRVITEATYEKLGNNADGMVVICDEASMTNGGECARLINLYSKVIFVGDNFQLTPIEGEAWFQTIDPDVTLKEIVRTAALSEITQIANLMRRRSPEWKKTAWRNEVSLIHQNDYDAVEAALKTADIVIANKNVTCDYRNAEIRELRGLAQLPDTTMPRKDDMLLAWETDTAAHSAFVKSESYKVVKAYPSPGAYMVILKGFNQPILVNAATLQAQKSEIRHPNPQVRNFSYAHCITAHKSQGSEWNNVVVLASDKWTGHNDYWNWLYTSATRAKARLTVVI